MVEVWVLTFLADWGRQLGEQSSRMQGVLHAPMFVNG